MLEYSSEQLQLEGRANVHSIGVLDHPLQGVSLAEDHGAVVYTYCQKTPLLHKLIVI